MVKTTESYGDNHDKDTVAGMAVQPKTDSAGSQPTVEEGATRTPSANVGLGDSGKGNSDSALKRTTKKSRQVSSWYQPNKKTPQARVETKSNSPTVTFRPRRLSDQFRIQGTDILTYSRPGSYGNEDADFIQLDCGEPRAFLVMPSREMPVSYGPRNLCSVCKQISLNRLANRNVGKFSWEGFDRVIGGGLTDIQLNFNHLLEKTSSCELCYLLARCIGGVWVSKKIQDRLVVFLSVESDMKKVKVRLEGPYERYTSWLDLSVDRGMFFFF
jgi:hypothetical protein